MSKVVRIQEDLLEYLMKIDDDFNIALSKLIAVYKEEQLFKDVKNRLLIYFKDNIEFVFKNVRLTDLQKKEVLILVQEELWKVKQGY